MHIYTSDPYMKHHMCMTCLCMYDNVICIYTCLSGISYAHRPDCAWSLTRLLCFLPGSGRRCKQEDEDYEQFLQMSADDQLADIIGDIEQWQRSDQATFYTLRVHTCQHVCTQHPNQHMMHVLYNKQTTQKCPNLDSLHIFMY